MISIIGGEVERMVKGVTHPVPAEYARYRGGGKDVFLRVLPRRVLDRGPNLR